MRHIIHTGDHVRRAAGLLLAVVLTFGSVAQTAAQAQRKGGAPRRVPTSAPAPSGAGSSCGWRGTIEINRNFKQSHTKVTAKGEHISDQFYSGTASGKSSFDYHARFDVRNSPGTYNPENGSFSATLRGTYDVNAIRESEERDNSTTTTDCFPDPPRTIVRSSLSSITERGHLEGPIDDAVLSVDDDGSFFFSAGFPELEGKRTHRTKVSVKGYCMSENDEDHDETDEGVTSFTQAIARVEGKRDPKNPNLLKGEFWEDSDTLITWNLYRPEGDCEELLTLRELRLEEHPFPNKTAWEEVGEATIDGNQVRLVAVVENKAKQWKDGSVTFKELTTGEVLETKQVSVPPKGEAEVEVVWDTNGYAWTDSGEKGPQREIEARLATGDSVSQQVNVSPKPVIMVHGLWSNAAAWGAYQGYLNEAHSFAWRGWAVGANPGVAVMNTGDHFMNNAPTNSIAQNAEQLGKQVKAVQEEQNAWHVDLVAHSMGGLISRHYIHALMPTDSPDKRPYVSHLVMLGTPNEGSACATLMYPGFKAAGHHVEALRQLMPSVVREFNQQVTNRKGVPFSILAGVPVPRTCHEQGYGDGVVSIPSALWKIDDHEYAPRVHTAITGREDFFSFVKPRLALGPKKARASAALRQRSDDSRDFGVEGTLLASLAPQAAAPAPEATRTRTLLSKALSVGPGQTAELPVRLDDKGDAGVTFVAPPAVKVSLVGADGTTQEPAEAAGPFRTFYLGEAGSWTLRFENAGGAAATAVATVWANEARALSVEFTELQRQPDGTLRLQAKVTGGAGAVRGAAVSVRLDGRPSETSLHDDGRHGDGAAGDGVYGATTGKVGTADTLVEVKAFSDGATATAHAFVRGGI